MILTFHFGNAYVGVAVSCINFLTGDFVLVLILIRASTMNKNGVHINFKFFFGFHNS